jgi:hypothetical protein
MNPFVPATIDFDEISKRNAETTVALLELMFRPDGEMPDENASKDFMTGVIAGLQDNLALIAEVKRLRERRHKIRDLHSPANSGNPAAPGAICTGCSVYGARVMWPCPTWNATEDPNPMPGFGMSL